MAGRVLLDTNIVIAYFSGEGSVQTALATTDEVFIPSVVVGELHYGALGSQRVDENLRRIGEFVTRAPILACDSTTAREYGSIKDALRRKGRPLPDNDIWIAASPASMTSRSFPGTPITRRSRASTTRHGRHLGRWGWCLTSPRRPVRHRTERNGIPA